MAELGRLHTLLVEVVGKMAAVVGSIEQAAEQLAEELDVTCLELVRDCSFFLEQQAVSQLGIHAFPPSHPSSMHSLL